MSQFAVYPFKLAETVRSFGLATPEDGDEAVLASSVFSRVFIVVPHVLTGHPNWYDPSELLALGDSADDATDQWLKQMFPNKSDDVSVHSVIHSFSVLLVSLRKLQHYWDFRDRSNPIDDCRFVCVHKYPELQRPDKVDTSEKDRIKAHVPCLLPLSYGQRVLPELFGIKYPITRATQGGKLSDNLAFKLLRILDKILITDDPATVRYFTNRDAGLEKKRAAAALRRRDCPCFFSTCEGKLEPLVRKLVAKKIAPYRSIYNLSTYYRMQDLPENHSDWFSKYSEDLADFDSLVTLAVKLGIAPTVIRKVFAIAEKEYRNYDDYDKKHVLKVYVTKPLFISNCNKVLVKHYRRLLKYWKTYLGETDFYKAFAAALDDQLRVFAAGKKLAQERAKLQA